MTRDIEKNDVNIAQLFKWSKVVLIEDKMTNQSVTLHLRLVGDADVNRARTRALRDSGELRKKLKDPKSEERVSFVNELQEIKDKETAVSFCILLDLDELQKQAMRDAKAPTKPKDLKSDATLEEQEKYQKKIDAYPLKYAKVVAKEVQKLREAEEERLGVLTFEEVYEHYETLVINRLCSTEMMNSFYEMIVFAATYTDRDFETKAFETFEDFDNVATKVKDELIKEYKTLELGMGVLKKLPEAAE